MDDIGIDCIRSNDSYDFKSKFDDTENNDGIYGNTIHECTYYEVDEFHDEIV